MPLITEATETLEAGVPAIDASLNEALHLIQETSGREAGASSAATANIAIRDIKAEVTRFFDGEPNVGTEVSTIPFTHFGLVVEFQQDTLLRAFDDAYVLRRELKDLITEYGVLLFKNVHLDNPTNAVFQKNIFGNLEFHVDRGSQFDNQYSMFYRDPKDREHHLPRKTSSLICPNAVTHLQANREGAVIRNRATLQPLFIETSPAAAIGSVILEQPWKAPAGTGEVCVFDNRTVMHASYHPNPTKGYKIAVQYLY